MIKFLITTLIFHSSFLLAQDMCQVLDKVPDFNCDSTVEIAVLGDSIVYGTGDSKNGGKGGYPLRAAKKFKNITINGYGVPGATTQELSSRIKTAFSDGNEGSKLREMLLNADAIFLDIGRNNFWGYRPQTDFVVKIASEGTFDTIVNLRDLIKSKVSSVTGKPPLVILTVLYLPNRGSQGPFVKALNKLISKSHTNTKLADLKFDGVSKRLIGADQIHPTSRGYDALAKVFNKYLTTKLPVHIKRERTCSCEVTPESMPNP